MIVIGVKQADEGHGLVVRLWEITGQATTAHLRLDRHILAAKAVACNLVEEPERPLQVQGGVISVPIRGSGLATVRIDARARVSSFCCGKPMVAFRSAKEARYFVERKATI